MLINTTGIQQLRSVLDEPFFEKAKTEIAVNAEASLHLITRFLKLAS